MTSIPKSLSGLSSIIEKLCALFKKHSTIALIIGICFMEKAFFRLNYVESTSIIPFFMACTVFVLGKKLPQKSFCLRRFICIVSTAFLFSFLTTFGSIRELYNGSILRIAFDTFVVFIGLLFLFTVFVTHAFDLAEVAYDKLKLSPASTEETPGIKTKKHLIIYALICMLGWTPLFLRFYPGSFGADSINQIRQAMHLMKYGNHLPVVSTWLIEIFYKAGFAITGNVNAALAFYTVFQMLLTALTYAACICYLEYHHVNKKLCYILLAILALCPMIAMYAIYIHKDTPAANLLLLVIIYLHYFYTKDNKKQPVSKKHYIWFSLLSIAFMLFRSNHYFVFLGLFLCTIFAFKNLRKTLLILMLISIVISSIFKGPVLKSMGITGADTAETMSMPLQMVSYTLSVGGNISNEDKAFLENILPCQRLAEVYSETSANPVKRAIRDEGNKLYLEEHRKEFLRLFIRVFVKNPAPCLIALIDHSKGYYCPKFTHPEMIMGTWDNDFGAYTDSLLPEGIGMQIYLFAQNGYDLYEKYLGCGMATWLTIFLLFFAIYKKKNFITYMPSLGIVGTFLLASPNVGRFRYQYPVMTAALILIGITFILSDEKIE